MKSKWTSWILPVALGLVLLRAGTAQAAYDITNYARIHDWHDQGCRMFPGGPGAAASGADQAGGNQMHCTVCGGAGGRPAWWVDEPYLNLWVVDEPMSYAMSCGQEMSFRFIYRQRYTLPQPDECPNYYFVGLPVSRGAEDPYLEIGMRTYGMTNASWSHNWLMDMQFWDSVYEAGQSQTPYNSYEAWVWRPEGGVYYFQTNVSGQPVLMDAQSQARLQPLSALGRPATNTTPPGADGIYWGDPATNGFRLLYPDGSQDVLSLCDYRFGTGATTVHAFLTKRIDPQGRMTRVGYEWVAFTNYWQAPPYYASYAVFRARYVVDPDGRTNVFNYHTNAPDGNPDHAARHAWQVVEIDDPYGRKAQLNYDDYSGLLTSITDAGGMTNSFTYLSPSGWITNLTTPYGTTSFNCIETTGQTNGVKQRALLATEPNNAYQLYYFLQNSQTLVPGSSTNVPSVANSTFDTGSVGTNCPQLYYRNSFYWDRRQTAAFSTNFYQALQGLNPSFPSALTKLAGADYNRARLRHWLLGADGISITESLSSERDPAPDPPGPSEGSPGGPARTWYDYANKPSPEIQGDAQIWCLARVLPDNTTAYTRYTYWPAGYPYFGGLLEYNESSYSLTNGAIGVRTNWYYYSTNTVDLLSIVNSFGQRVDLGYTNTNHQVNFITNVLGQVSQIGYDTTTRNLTSLNLPSGQSALLTYYAAGSPPATTNSMLQSISLQPQGLVVQVLAYSNGLPQLVQTSGRGLPALSVTQFWDGLNRLTGAAFPDGTTTSNVYDRLYLGAAKDRLGNWIGYKYDNLEHLTTITDALTNVTTLGWCGCGALNSITDATLTNTTWFLYNNQGLLTNIVFADNSSLTYTLDSLGRMVRAADGQGYGLNYWYNNQGLLTTVSNAYGLAGRVVYDAADRPYQVTDANNVTVTYQFDLLNRLTNRFWADAVGESFGWSTNGLVAYTNRDSKVTRLTRDGAGRLTGVTNANQEITQIKYNCLNQLTNLVDGRTNLTTWNFDGYGLLINKVDALGHEALHLYRDANGQVTNRWTPQFGYTAYTWDACGNLRTISNAAQALISYAYDADNRLRTMADAVGTTTFGYTPVGQLQSETGAWANDTLTYSYSQQLRQTLTLTQPGGNWTESYVPDAARRLYSLTSPAGTFSYNYDAQRTLLPTLLTLPNSASITNHYDSFARLDYTALVNYWGHVLDGYGYGYDYLGLRTGIVRNLGLTNSSVTVGYDAIGQLTSWQAKEGTNGLARLNEQFGFGFDQAGNLRSRTNGNLVQTFTNDVLNELTIVTRSNTMTVSGVTPAPATSVTVNGQSAQTYGDFTFARTNVTLSNGQNSFSIVAHSAAGTNATNNLTANLPASVTLLYDSNGNLTNDGTRSFSYDADNRVLTNWVVSSWKTESVYDGLGRRRIQRDYAWQGSAWSKTNEIHLVYDGWLLVQERDANNNVLVTYTRGLDLSASLGRAGGIGGLLARTDGNGSTYYHADGNGNITSLTDGSQNIAARYLYSAFGRLVGMWGPMAGVNRMMFSSKEFDPRSGLYYYGSRFFDPTLQRWLSRDPIGERGDINLYRGMFNSPLNVVDRDGDDNYLPGGENATAGLSFSMKLPVAPPTPPSMGPASGLAVPFNQGQLPNAFTYDALLIGAPHLVGTPIGYDLGQLNAELINTALIPAVGGSLLKAPSLVSKCPVKSFPTKAASREALRQMGLAEEQLAKALSAVSRATSSSSISIVQEGENLVVTISRPGFEGYQAVESTIAPDGTKQVIQKAYDSLGKLVHYDPKTP